MHHRILKLFWGLTATASLLALATLSPAALESGSGTVPAGFHVQTSPTSDAGDPLSAYLPKAPAMDAGLAPSGLVTTTSPDLTTISRPASRTTLRAPVSAPKPDPSDPFAGLEFSGLSNMGKDERAIPLGETGILSMGPGGFGRFMTGRPLGAIANWCDSSETSISYVRPHMNVQMMLALEMPGGESASAFEGPGLTSHAVLDIDHRAKVDSDLIGQRSGRFGVQTKAPPVDEPQTAVSVGLDMGLLPTFLAQMGVSVSVVVSRGQETGDSRVALVGTTELPIDWGPREHPMQHPNSLPQQPTATEGVNQPYLAASGDIGGGGTPTDSGTPTTSTPIVPTPPVPEPTTLTLLGAAAAAFLAARRRRNR
jgi:hypothetical protein